MAKAKTDAIDQTAPENIPPPSPPADNTPPPPAPPEPDANTEPPAPPKPPAEKTFSEVTFLALRPAQYRGIIYLPRSSNSRVVIKDMARLNDPENAILMGPAFVACVSGEEITSALNQFAEKGGVDRSGFAFYKP